MSKWKVTLSDGRVATLEGDTEPTEQDALAAIGTLHPGTPETSTDELKPWTPAQRLRYSPVGQAILGPTEEEKARQVGRSNIGLAEIPSAFLQMSTLGIPPVQEAEQKFTEFQKGIAAKLPGALGQAAQIPIGIQHGIRQALLGFPVLPLPAVGPAAGATRTVGRGLFGYFAAEWASQLPEQYKQYQEAVAKGDYSTASGIAANAASMAAMMGLGAKEALKKGAPNAIPQRETAPVSVEKSPGDRPQVEPQVRIETSAEKEAAAPVLSPEHDALVQAEAKEQGVKIRLTQLAPRVTSTIDRATGEVLIDPAQLTEEIRNVPEKRREQYVRSLLNEEKIHLGVTDEQALAYLGSLSRPEVAIATRIYTGKWGRPAELSRTQLAHDALRFRLQQLARMTPREIAEAAWRERWTVQSLDAVGRSIQGARELMNLAGGKEGLAIIRAIDNNLGVAKVAAGAKTQDEAYEAVERAGMTEGAAPAAATENEPFAITKQEVEKDISDYEELSKRFRQIGMSHPDTKKVWQAREDIKNKYGGMEPTEAMLEPAAFRKGKQKGEPTKEFFLPPVPQGTQVERGVELPRPSLTPAQIEAQATKHVTETSRPSFAQFAEEATKELPSLKPEQLRSVWQDAVWKRLMSASGGDLESLRNQLGLAREVGSGDISDAPASQEAFRLGVRDREAETAVRPTQNYRNRVIARIGEKLIGEAEQGRKAWRRPAVNPEEVATYKGEGAYREISPADVKNPDELGRLLTEGAGVERTTSTRKVRGGELVEVKRKAPPESVTRRLTALVNKSTGKVYLVSTYRHGRLGAMLVDPAATKAERPNVPLKSLLNRGYQPIASMLLDEPVQNFKQGFANVADWQARFAGEVAKAQAAEASYLPTTEGEFTTGPGGARVATPGVFQEREGAVASREPMTDAEAGSILDHVVGEVGTLEGVEDVKLAMETLPTEKNQQVLSAWRKLARAVEAANPDATVEELKNKLADTIYENHRQAQDFQDFQRKTMAAANPENRPGVGPPPAPAPAAQPSAAARAAVEPAAWNKHVRAATKETSRAFDNFIARPLDAYSGWMVNRMREHGGVASEMAGMLFNRVISRQKQVYGSMTPSLDPALRLAGKGSKANAWLNSLTKHPGGRTGTAKLFDAGEGRIPVPAFARPSLDVYNAANLATGRVLEPVTPDWAASGRYQRNVTPFGYDLIRQGKGPLWQAWVQDTARINGVPHGITARFFREWKAALDDPGLDVNRIEKINQDFERQYPRVVTHLKIGEGVTTRWEPVVHSRVFNYLQNTALRASHIRAFREAFPATEVGRKRLATMDDQVREELSPEFQEDYNALLKTLQGHPSDTYGGAGPLSAGGPIAESFRWLNQTAGNLFARMVLTGQMFVQPGENIAGSTPVFLGYRNYLRGLARVKHLLPQLEQEGKINRVIYDNSSDPTSPVRTAFRRAGNVLSRGFGEQLLNELQEWHAAATAQIVSERIQAGTLSGWEMRMLPETFKAMGFSPAEAQRMMQGDRNLLGQFERKSAAFLTSGNKAMAEGSRLGSNRLFNSIFRFQSYPMMKMNQFRRLWGGLSDAWQMGTREQKVAATELFSRFLFGTAVQGALTVGISALAYEGFTGAKIRATEAKDDPLTFLLESAMATLGGPFYLVWRGARSKGIYGIGEQFTRLLFPYSIARDMFDAAHGSGQYKDLDAFERIGKFVASKTPGTRAIKLGMAVFGLSQEDTKLDGSIKSFYRWRRDTLGFKESQDFLQSDERAAFRKAMKRAVEALKIGDREKFSEAFAEAVGESGNAKAVAQSFRARKLLRTPEGAKLNFDQLDALRRHVGDDAVDRLEYFDAMLDAASHGVVLPKGD